MKYRIEEEKTLHGSVFFAQAEVDNFDKSKGLGRVLKEWCYIHPDLSVQREYRIGACVVTYEEARGRVCSHKACQEQQERYNAAKETIYHDV